MTVIDAPAKTAELKRDWWQRRYTFTGTAVGMLFLWLSLTPSLLPRGPLFQGIVSGAAGAIGYGLGVFLVWLVRFMQSRPSSPPAPRWAWGIPDRAHPPRSTDPCCACSVSVAWGLAAIDAIGESPRLQLC